MFSTIIFLNFCSLYKNFQSAKHFELWKISRTKNLPEIADLQSNRNDFHNLFGVGFTGVDYNKDATEMDIIDNI